MKPAAGPRSIFGFFFAGLLCLVLLHAACIALFTSGFLLTRVELGAQSGNEDFASWLRDTNTAPTDSEASHSDREAACAAGGHGDQDCTCASETADSDEESPSSITHVEDSGSHHSSHVGSQTVGYERSALWQSGVFDRVVIVVIDAARCEAGRGGAGRAPHSVEGLKLRPTLALRAATTSLQGLSLCGSGSRMEGGGLCVGVQRGAERVPDFGRKRPAVQQGDREQGGGRGGGGGSST